MNETAEFGALLQMTARPGEREALLHVLRNYLNTLDGEPGTTLFAIAADPNDETWSGCGRSSPTPMRSRATSGTTSSGRCSSSSPTCSPDRSSIRPLAPVAVTR